MKTHKYLLFLLFTIVVLGCSVNKNNNKYIEVYFDDFSFTYMEPKKWLKESNSMVPNSLILNYIKRGPNGREMSIALIKNSKKDINSKYIQKQFQSQFTNLTLTSDSLTSNFGVDLTYVMSGEIKKQNSNVLYITSIMAVYENIEYNIVISNLNVPVSKNFELMKLINGIRIGEKYN